MSTLFENLRQGVSNLWLDIELFFERFNPNKKSIKANETETSLRPAAPAATLVKPAVAPASPVNPGRNHPISVPQVVTAKQPVVAKPATSAVQPSAQLTPQPSVQTKVVTHSEFPKSKISPDAKGKVKEKEKVKPLKKMPLSLKFLRLSNKELLFFYSQLETLIDSGVTLIDSLLILQSQTRKKGAKKLYDEMINHINGGMSLAETMYLFPKVFPSMQAALIEAGERSGNLQNVLKQIVEDMEGRQEFVRKIKGAMFYPVVLIVLALTMVAGMMIFVIPKVAELYDQSNAQLPALTQFVIDLSGFVSTNYLYILLGVFGSVFLMFSFVHYTTPGKFLWEKLVSIVPVFGGINKEKNLMVFTANLGMLMQSGVLISEAFEITEKTMGNLHYKKELAKIRSGIVMGRNVSEMMGLEDIKTQKYKNNKLFPLQVAQMIHIGELTGNIAKMLMKIKENYHKSIDYKLKNISAMIEPIMIFIVALLVGSILLAVMLPFFYIGTTIS